MHDSRRPLTATMIVCCVVAVACTGIKPTRFTNPQFDFAFVEKVAVLPLENLSNDQQAAARATRMLVTELLSSGSVEVVEPGEVQAALDRVRGARAMPSTEQVVQLGKALGVQAVIVGTVTQSENIRAGTVSVPVVTLDLHMLETETGAPVWAATHTERGGGLGTKLLGTGAEPISETTRRCVRRVLRSLVR